MACKDTSTTYLKNLGYNVVRHPRQGITPLGIIGSRKKSANHLGHIQYLLSNPPASFPNIKSVSAGDINGEKSDSLELGLGLNILGNIIGAMGGNLGITSSYTNASKVQFSFANVELESIPLLELGAALKDATVDIRNPVIEPYLSKGSIYLIASSIKSDTIEVDYQDNSGVGVKVDVPVLKEVVGGNVEVKSSNSSKSSVSFKGNAHLVFGFTAFEIGLDEDDGTITLTPAAAKDSGFLSAPALAHSEDEGKEPKLVQFASEDEGLLDM